MAHLTSIVKYFFRVSLFSSLALAVGLVAQASDMPSVTGFIRAKLFDGKVEIWEDLEILKAGSYRSRLSVVRIGDSGQITSRQEQSFGPNAGDVVSGNRILVSVDDGDQISVSLIVFEKEAVLLETSKTFIMQSGQLN
jgi:hypothetical protein